MSTADIADANSAAASFQPDVTGEYTFELEVSDGEESDSDTVVVLVDLPADNVGAWFFNGTFDERSGSAITTTTVAGSPGFAEDRYGAEDAALDLPSGDDGVEIASYAGIASTPNGLSLSFWVSGAGGDGRVISRRYGEGDGVVSWEFDIINSYDDMRLSYGGSVVANISLTANFTEPMNHLIMIFDTPNERWKLYINRLKIYDDPQTHDIQTTFPIRIGKTGMGGMSGQFDDLIIFNRAIDEADIHALYHHRE